MSAPLTLVRMVPDMRALAQAAASAGFIPTGGDMGYALHAALLAIFGPELAPQPFTLRDGTVMGYSAASPEDLLTAVHLQPASMEALAQALGPHRLEARTMPQKWRVDQELDLEVRIRPIIRSRAGRGRAKGGRELDAFVMNAPPEANRHRRRRDKHCSPRACLLQLVTRRIGSRGGFQPSGCTYEGLSTHAPAHPPQGRTQPKHRYNRRTRRSDVCAHPDQGPCKL